MPTPSDRVAHEPLPAELRRAMLRARASLDRCRGDRSVSTLALAQARTDLMTALEAYVGCLAEHGLPVPYALRDELRLWRGSLSADLRLRYQPGPERPRR
jgi:hypothetical protein